MVGKTKSKGERTKSRKLAEKEAKLGKNAMKKIKGGLAGGINWGDGSQTSFTPPFPSIKKK